MALSIESKKMTGSWKSDMRSGSGVSAAMNALEEHIGHDLVSSVVLYEDHIFVDAPVGTDTLNADTWQ